MERKGRPATLGVICFMTFIFCCSEFERVLPLSSDLGSEENEKDHKTNPQCRWELSGSHRVPFSRWVSVQLCSSRRTPFLLLSLFIGFPRNQLSKSGKHNELGQ
jgi:hypothetical protein